MSIQDKLAKYKNSKLFLFEHQIKSEPTERYIWVPANLKKDVQMPFPWDARGQRRAKMRASMEHFTSGGHIIWATHPKDKPPKAFLAPVKPLGSEVRDIRVLEHGRIRVFGRFGLKNNFIALNWDYRENLEGGEFDKAVFHCMDLWRDLFSDEPLFSGASADAYISGRFSVV